MNALNRLTNRQVFYNIRLRPSKCVLSTPYLLVKPDLVVCISPILMDSAFSISHITSFILVQTNWKKTIKKIWSLHCSMYNNICLVEDIWKKSTIWYMACYSEINVDQFQSSSQFISRMAIWPAQTSSWRISTSFFLCSTFRVFWNESKKAQHQPGQYLQLRICRADLRRRRRIIWIK